MEQIKNNKGELLPQPYLDLARMRREQNPNNVFPLGFASGMTREGLSFWNKVYYCNTPEIPAASLAELGEWQKAKGIAELQPAEPDWKAMYEEIKAEQDYYRHEYELKLMELDDIDNTPTPTRSLVAECVPFQKCPVCDGYGEVRPIWNKDAQQPTYVKCSVCEGNKVILMYNAEAMAAEGRKRGHLPNTENEKA